VAPKVIKLCIFHFRREKLNYAAMVCDLNDIPIDGNDTVDDRAIEFIEEVDINDSSYY
jgi:hypothetical protein